MPHRHHRLVRLVAGDGGGALDVHLGARSARGALVHEAVHALGDHGVALLARHQSLQRAQDLDKGGALQDEADEASDRLDGRGARLVAQQRLLPEKVGLEEVVHLAPVHPFVNHRLAVLDDVKQVALVALVDHAAAGLKGALLQRVHQPELFLAAERRQDGDAVEEELDLARRALLRVAHVVAKVVALKHPHHRVHGRRHRRIARAVVHQRNLPKHLPLLLRVHLHVNALSHLQHLEIAALHDIQLSRRHALVALLDQDLARAHFALVHLGHHFRLYRRLEPAKQEQLVK
mmetsp:Transcript_6810/g.12336  ORF Transcript_6810/g.12336 Transcript_6810/m.12336 type:complete len:290 (+) Transcript_6810:1409-2278(+)